MIPFCVLCVVTLMLMTSHHVDGCFDPKILDPFTVWIQPLSLENRLYYYVDIPSKGQMRVESEINFPKYSKRIYTCLESWDNGRVLVQVEEEGKKTRFQCLQFKVLANNVLRQAKTKLRGMRKKDDCKKEEEYITDEAVLVSKELTEPKLDAPQSCPLRGGYQILLYEGGIVRGHCMDSVHSYNPNIRFQCDQHNVIADFGRDCEPPILKETQKMRGRHIAYLSCVASWNEKGNINSLLLRMRDQPYTFWCMHYKMINKSKEILSIFMTLDGRCVANAFHDESVPKTTSLFGHLASYVPLDDPRCSDSKALDHCREKRPDCFGSNECPGKCGRCNVKPSMSGCSFMLDALGHWETVDSRQQMTVDINKTSFRVKNYGEFSCRDEFDRDLPGRVYPVVQADESSSCLPYYACAHVFSTSPGVLDFKLQPAWRDEDSGEPFTCKQTDDKVGFVIPIGDEKSLTLINTDRLVKSSCGFDHPHKFPTQVGRCLLDVGECGGDCSVIVVNYDAATCGTHTGVDFPFDSNHTCYGEFEFTDGIHGILTYSERSGRYFCWIYSHSRLFIASPEECNSKSVQRILADREASITYDPAERLSNPVVSKSNNSGQIMKSHVVVVFLVLLFPVWNGFGSY